MQVFRSYEFLHLMCFQDYSLTPPAQELIAKDLHGNEWKFRHIFRGDFSKTNFSSFRIRISLSGSNFELFSIPLSKDFTELFQFGII